MPRPTHPVPRWTDTPEDPDTTRWRTAKRKILLASDDPIVWPILAAHYEARPIRFLYWGGSNPGETREVIPLVLFTVAGFHSVWFEAWCPMRQAKRTFNCKKIQLLPDPPD